MRASWCLKSRQLDCLDNSLFMLTTNRLSTLWFSGPLWRNLSVIGGFPSQSPSNMESVPMTLLLHILKDIHMYYMSFIRIYNSLSLSLYIYIYNAPRNSHCLFHYSVVRLASCRSNHRQLTCLFYSLFRLTSMKTPKLRMISMKY